MNTRRVHPAWAVLSLAVSAAPAAGQTARATDQRVTITASERNTRPATTTFLGDTGLWFVPVAEVLPAGNWSGSVYRRGTNFLQGFTNVADFAATFAYGFGGRTELFGSFLFDTRIDRDLRPTFLIFDEPVGGVLDQYPRVRKGWTGNSVGDLFVGAKFNISSEDHAYPAALAVRGGLKVPTGDDEAGVSTGKTDVFFDLVVSKDAAQQVDLAAYAGYEFRGEPEGFATPGGAVRWGAGAGFPSHGGLRGVLEMNGVLLNDRGMLTLLPFVAGDGSRPPFVSTTENTTRATAGLTWQHANGVFVGGGVGWNLPMESRRGYTTDEDAFGDFVDLQFRIGFHPGVNSLMLPPPPPAQPAPAAAAPVNRPPTVQARCEPCMVEAGRPATVTAMAQDPDGDTLTYRWNAPAGAVQNPSDRQTMWTAPREAGPVQLTVRVDDGKGGTATATVTLQVVRPALVELVFEDIYFDFDRSTLRPEALRLLDEALARLMANPDRNLIIEGHTCNIGTSEYNLALGDRRAGSVRTYLTSRGIAASRLEVRSYGEERPKYDNGREETRRLNRRAALVVRIE